MQTAPVLACRRDGSNLNVRGSIGLAIPGTTLKIVDPETLKEVADGELGLILAAGPGVMRRYRNDPSSTQTAMRAGQGLFDTGDLGWRAPGIGSTLQAFFKCASLMLSHRQDFQSIFKLSVQHL